MISKHVILRMDTVEKLHKYKLEGQTFDGCIKELLKKKELQVA